MEQTEAHANREEGYGMSGVVVKKAGEILLQKATRMIERCAAAINQNLILDHVMWSEAYGRERRWYNGGSMNLIR